MHFTDRAVIIPCMPHIFLPIASRGCRFALLAGVLAAGFVTVSHGQTPLQSSPGAAPAQSSAQLRALAQAQPRAEAGPLSQSLPGNPYGAIVPVQDESQKSRDTGIRMALIQVLKGAVGGYDDRTTSILAQAPRLVQQYSFVRDESGEGLMFRAVFDPAAVDAALRSQGLPVFGINSSVIENWVVEVHGLRTTSDYSRVLRHFTRIKGVRTVDVDELRGDTLRLRMVVEGGIAMAADRAESGDLISRDTTGNYVLARR